MTWETSEHGAAYLRVAEGTITRTADYGTMYVLADYDENGTLIGLEFLGGQAHVMAAEAGTAG